MFLVRVVHVYFMNHFLLLIQEGGVEEEGFYNADFGGNEIM